MASQSAFGGDDLDRLLLRLDSDRTFASKKYEEVRRKLIKFFDWNSCSLRAEALTDETLNRIAEKLKTEAIQNVNAYALSVARFVRLEDVKRHRRESSIEDIPGGIDFLVNPGDSEAEIVERIDGKIRHACLRECRAKLRPQDSAFAIAYYSADGDIQKVHRQRLAKTLDTTMPALRARANRLRDKLEHCVNRCLEGRRKTVVKPYGRGQAEFR
jgi:hypothetical protein